MSAVGLPVFTIIPPTLEDKVIEYYQKTGDLGDYDLAIASQQAIAQLRTERYLIPQPVGFMPATPITLNMESDREVWDVATTGSMPGTIVISNKFGRSNPDLDAITCYDHMGQIDQFARFILKKHPVQNSSKLMKSLIHIPKKLNISLFNNAAWVSTREAVLFGDVDPKFYKPFVTNFDITAHEFGHAVTHYSANFKYEHQSGALNESMSDVIAIMMKHQKSQTVSDGPDANWWIADGIFVQDSKGALRSMSDPGKAFKFTIQTPRGPVVFEDNQVKHMQDYIALPSSDDNGGVHKFSGIPNHAFYLVARQMGGFCWEKPGQIWDLALSRGKREDDFRTFAGRTIQAAKDLGFNNAIQQCVSKAWYDVGIDLRQLSATSSGPSKLSSNLPYYLFGTAAVGFMAGWVLKR